MNVDWIVLGLGNPGMEYASTRHNIGFRVAEKFVWEHGGTFTRGHGEWMESTIKHARTTFVVALPLTYMNRSGIAAKKILARCGLQPDQLIAIVDEYNFPLGRIHLKHGGSDGGHNGIASIIEHLQSDKFWRLRCGIDRNFGEGELVDYVLSSFTPQELPLVEQMIIDAVNALDTIAKLGINRSVSEINSQSKKITQMRNDESYDLGQRGGSGSRS